MEQEVASDKELAGGGRELFADGDVLVSGADGLQQRLFFSGVFLIVLASADE